MDTGILLAKLRSARICGELLAFITDYLSSRRAVVIVNGVLSDAYNLQDMVFQGTVRGSGLWNVIFKDIRVAAESTGGAEAKFADDLTITKNFPATVSNEDVLAGMEQCQANVHEWGSANRICFDPTKEEFAVLHHVHGSGPDFRLLGPTIDAKLVMREAVGKVVRTTRPKLRSMLRSRRFYPTADLVLQFKAHILSRVESVTSAVYHASSTVLAPLDRLLDSFLGEIGVSRSDGFLLFNLAPLCLRRDIAMLGLLHKCSIGDAAPSLCSLFPPAPLDQNQSRYSTRLATRRHDRQLLERCQGQHLDIMARSIFGLSRIYNLLPQAVVDSSGVTIFQSQITNLAREACREGGTNWCNCFSPRQ